MKVEPCSRVIMDVTDLIIHTVNPTGVVKAALPRPGSSDGLLDADNCRLVNFPSYHQWHTMVLQLLAAFSPASSENKAFKGTSASHPLLLQGAPDTVCQAFPESLNTGRGKKRI